MAKHHPKPAPAPTPAPTPDETPVTAEATPPAEPPADPVADAPPAAAAPPVGDLPQFFEFLFPAEVKPILGLFDAEFETHEIWDAMEACASLGRKAEAFLDGRGGGSVFGLTNSPAVRATVAAATVAPQELCEQMEAALDNAEDAPVSVGATATEAQAQPLPKKMNPVLAGLLITLIQRVAAEVVRRLSAG